MQAETRTEKIDVKKVLGNPKITFIIGAPGSGKGTQCEKLVEEFGFTHISTGDLMRNEMSKGTRDGDRIRQLVDQGKLVPVELTCQVLINALIANPSQNYLIDGFPRAVEQATYFESNVCEAQNVLFFDCDEEQAIKRCMKRAETSGRSDDNQETIVKRFTAYNEQSKPVKEFYGRFGKVREIESNGDPLEIYEQTRRAMLPQISCIIGPKACGKTALGAALCDRTNMKLVNFNNFVEDNRLEEEDDEVVTSALIKMLSREISPRVLLEDFPQSEYQAKFFIKNCTTPSRVFSLECSKDICQERMIQVASQAGSYQSSSILSKKIRLYKENSAKLLPYLKGATNFKTVNTEQIFETALKQLSSSVEPTVLIVRPSGIENAHEIRKEIISKLVDTQGFVELNVHNLIREENERHTEIGKEITSLVSAGKAISNELIVKMLRKIIYSGIEDRNKFILTDFPDSREQAQDFEAQCSSIKAVILACGPDQKIEIVDNALHEDSIDAFFQKGNRLKPLKGWDETLFREQLGNKVDWAIVKGESLSGKTTVAKMIAESTKGKVLDLRTIAEAIRPRLATDEGEFEGRIPDAEVEKDVKKIVMDDMERGEKFLYLFDGQYHETVDAAVAFLTGAFGAPTQLITTTAIQSEIVKRFKEGKEMGEADELGEEDQQELKDRQAAAQKEAEQMSAALAQYGDRVKEISLDTGVSKETLTNELRSQFCVKVIIVNHDKKLNVDVVCSNLSIKYNMLYLSVYQLIKGEIESNTEMGRKLQLTKQTKAIDLRSIQDDPFSEQQYSAAHFDQALVIQLVQQKIAESRTSQKFILLEGLCNSNKLSNASSQLELRFMDEFFSIEKNIGEVSAVISLSDKEDKTTFQTDQIQEPVEEVVEEVKKDNAGDDDDAADDPPADGDDGAEKKVVWKPTDYRWTLTNGKARNLPQLCRDYRSGKIQDDSKNWKNYGVASHPEAVVRALDELCGRVSEDTSNMLIYQQVIFTDD